MRGPHDKGTGRPVFSVDLPACLHALLAASDGVGEGATPLTVVHTIADGRLIPLASEQLVQQRDTEGLHDLASSLAPGADLAECLREARRGPALQQALVFVASARAVMATQAGHVGAACEHMRRALAALAGPAGVHPGPAPTASAESASSRLRSDPRRAGDGMCAVFRAAQNEDYSWAASALASLVAELLGSPRHPIRSVRANALLAEPAEPFRMGARTALLTVGIVRRGSGVVVPDLHRTPPLGQEFTAGMRDVRTYLLGLVDGDGNRVLDRDVDVMFRVGSADGHTGLPSLDGRSMTALLAAVSENLLRGGPVTDQSCSATADLHASPDGNQTLGPVKHIRAKVDAAFDAGLRSVVVAEDDADLARQAAVEAYDGYEADRAAGGDDREERRLLEVLPCTTVPELVRILTRETQWLVAYMDDARAEMTDELKLIRPEWRSRFREELYQPPAIVEPEADVGGATLRVRRSGVRDGEPRRQDWVDYRRTRHIRRAVIRAEAGYGKSTLIQMMAWEDATESTRKLRAHTAGTAEVPVPFFFRCADLEDDRERPLLRSMVADLDHRHDLTRGQMRLLKDLLTSRQAVIFWDALDEADDPRTLAHRAARFARRQPAPSIYITCRTRHLPDFAWPQAADGVHVELAPFYRDSLLRFIAGWGRMSGHPERAQDLASLTAGRASVNDLLAVPVLAALACVHCVDGSAALDPHATRVELLEACLHAFEERWEREKGRSFTLSPTERRAAMEHVAWHFASRGEFGPFPKRELLAALAAVRGPHGRRVQASPDEALAELSLLVPHGGPHSATYRFLLRLIHEYLAACVVSRRSQPFLAIEPVLRHPDWDETIRLVAGMLQPDARAANYIGSIGDAGSSHEEHLGRDCALACRCIAEREFPRFLAMDQVRPLVDRLASMLVSCNRFRHRRGYRAIPDVGPFWVAAVPALLDYMTHDDDFASCAAALGLFEGHPLPALECLPQLFHRLADDDEQVRYVAEVAISYASYALAGLARPAPCAQKWSADTPVPTRVDRLESAVTKAVRILRAAARADDLLVEGWAVTCLSALGPSAEAALPELLAVLQTRYSPESVEARVIHELERGRPAWGAALHGVVAVLGSAALPHVLRGLSDRRPDILQTAISLAERLGTEARDALPLLYALSRCDDPQAARAAGYAVEAIEAPTRLNEILPLLSDQSARLRGIAAKQLVRHIPVSVALPPLLEATRRPEVHARLGAIEALGGFGADAAEAVPRLRTVLHDESSDVRAAAIRTLGGMGSVARTAMADVLAALHDPSAAVRTHAADAIYAMGATLTAALSPLRELASDPHSYVRQAAARTIFGPGRGSPEVLPDIVHALQDPDRQVWRDAQTALRALDAELVLALPLLEAAIDDPDQDARARVVRPLGPIGPTAAPLAPSVARLLSDSEPDVRVVALSTLHGLGTPAEVLPAVVDARHDLDPEVRAAAVRTLGAASLQADVVPEIVDALSDSDHGVRGAAVHALSALGRGTAAVVDMLGDADPSVREAVVEALPRLPLPDPDLITHLRMGLSDASSSVRRAAVLSIGGLGSRGAGALADLCPLLPNDDNDTAWEACRAVEAILESLAHEASAALPVSGPG